MKPNIRVVELEAPPAPPTIKDVAAWLGVPASAVKSLPPSVREGLVVRLAETADLADTVSLHDELNDRVRSLINRLQREARTDTLTGLANRRAIEERLQEETERTDRYRRPMAVFVVDVDGLKSVNDRFGHAAGDALLRELAVRLRWAVRSTDYIGRVGGDEFVVICPETDSDTAAILAEALALRAKRGPVPDYDDVSISVSVGWAVRSPGDDEEAIAVLGAADARLYAGREQTRSRQVIGRRTT